jgi:thiamine pyrophosphokinase
MKTIAVVAGGNLTEGFLSEIKKSTFIIGVDKGAYWLISHTIIPNVAIGDFDSVSKQEFEKIEKKSKKVTKYPTEKNWTDLELAMNHAVALHPKNITIYGAYGTRIDHSFAAIGLLEKLAQRKIYASIIDMNNSVSIVDTTHVLKKSDTYTYVSLLPLTTEIVVSMQGFKYNVTKKKIRKGETIGISNEIDKDKGIITIHAGTALLVQSRD